MGQSLITNLIEHLTTNKYQWGFKISKPKIKTVRISHDLHDLDCIDNTDLVELVVWRGKNSINSPYHALYHSMKSYEPLTAIQVYVNRDQQLFDVDTIIMNDTVDQIALF
ncbi:MAG: hypothetical protein LBT37_06125 [Lactobacillaceae bacterium]|jgi:hypothetical protein|nr:hypothetical protein [Lactobacillaceae bacterium]